MGRTERTAYLARLGLDPEPPSVEALTRVHRAHVERVPYETLWIHLGERWSIDPAESATRIAMQGRGGYCYHLNSGLGALLDALGYDVSRHVGGVHGPAGATGDAMANHLVLMVHGLPTAENPAGDWYVDAGLGDALHEPLPLVAGSYRQEPYDLVLDVTPGGVGDWHLTHDPAGSFAGMSWRSAPTAMDAFAERHDWLSTSPDSGFVRVLTVQRRDGTGVDILRGRMLTRVGAGATETLLATRAELTDALRDLFGLDVGHVDADTWDAVWAQVRAAHDAWEAAGRP